MTNYRDKCELTMFDVVTDIVIDTKNNDVVWKPGFVSDDGIHVIHLGSYQIGDDATTFELSVGPGLAKLTIANESNPHSHMVIVSKYDRDVDSPIASEFRNLIDLIIEQQDDSATDKF